ncbi:MAG: pyridoxamine 5'-phosphate oxidase [Lysobacterales bacterium]|jgi:pyridoxamine 5'-phosphate oxidase
MTDKILSTQDIITMFSECYDIACAAEGQEAASMMSVSTIDKGGFPADRVVFFRGLIDNGFTFYTNYNSDKGRDIENSNKICLLFHWRDLKQQVRIIGTVQKTSRSASEAYWNKRSRVKQISALVSDQSQKVASYEDLVKEHDARSAEVSGGTIVCPEYWGGYVVKPLSVEFWQARDDRLHKREVYKRNGESWENYFLCP